MNTKLINVVAPLPVLISSNSSWACTAFSADSKLRFASLLHAVKVKLRKTDRANFSCFLWTLRSCFFYHGVVPLVFPYCCHCLQPWQQPKTSQGLQQVNIPLDDHCKPDLQCVMLDLGQDTLWPPPSMSQTITMHGCSFCWRQPLSL